MNRDDRDRRNVTLSGEKKTTIELEFDYWEMLDEIALHRGLTLNMLLQDIEDQRDSQPRASAIRIYVMKYYRLIAMLNGGLGQREIAVQRNLDNLGLSGVNPMRGTGELLSN
jgi:predicted DNA-binding ribbon-helix-helix protein